MRRSSLRLLLTFQSLLCGETVALPPPELLGEVSTRAADVFQRELSAAAPLPIPLASCRVLAFMKRSQHLEAATILATHPQQRAVLEDVGRYISRYPNVYSLSNLKNMMEVGRGVGGSVATTLLKAAVLQFYETQKAQQGSSEGSATEVEQLQSLLMRHIRFDPSAAAALLRPLCLISNTSAVHRDNVFETMQIAMREQRMDPGDFGYVLQCMWKARDARRVAHIWSWAQHTSACWDPLAVSVAVMAYSRMKKMDEAVECMQRLAETDVDISLEAQASFFSFLAERDPPLPQYAEQLANHWYPNRRLLWRGDAQAVGVQLLYIYFACGHYNSLVSLLEEVCESNSSMPEELQRFLRNTGVPVLGRHFSDLAVENPFLCKLFFDVPLSMEKLEEHPEVLGLLLCVGSSLDRVEDAYAKIEACEGLSIESFSRAVEFAAAQYRKRKVPASFVLSLLKGASARARMPLPAELEGWLQLASEI